jgi:hypothetical protein
MLQKEKQVPPLGLKPSVGMTAIDEWKIEGQTSSITPKQKCLTQSQII